MAVSGFTFVHNAIEGGYPIIEAIWAVWPYVDEMMVVDCESDDGTSELLRKLGVRIVPGNWGHKAGETLAAAHALHVECEGETIIHFEADEVFSARLMKQIRLRIEQRQTSLAVYRLQLEQNFQRCRWWPEPVHRVFPRGSVVKVGHTTDRASEADVLGPELGLLWDITNCFRDNWLKRVENQAALWDHKPGYYRVSLHFSETIQFRGPGATEEFLNEPHWTWTTTPFDIPESLKLLVGKTSYAETPNYRTLMDES